MALKTVARFMPRRAATSSPEQALVGRQSEGLPRLGLDPCAGAGTGQRHDLGVKLVLEVRDQVVARLHALELLEDRVIAAAGTLALPIGEEVGQGVLGHGSQPAAETAGRVVVETCRASGPGASSTSCVTSSVVGLLQPPPPAPAPDPGAVKIDEPRPGHVVRGLRPTLPSRVALVGSTESRSIQASIAGAQRRDELECHVFFG